MTCERYQQACYDLLDQTLSPVDERALMEHVGSCDDCRRFLEEEQARMRQWPRLLHVAARRVNMPKDALERVTHAMEVSYHSEATRFALASKISAAPFKFPWRMLVASVALLLGAAGVLRLGWTWQQAEPPVMAGMESARDDSVTLLRQQGALGIVLPATVPGRVALAAGEMCLRLGSGVELTVVGPLELMLETPMLARLEQGDLLAHVSPQARGFQVQTSRLHIWDLGTIFSVSAREESSKVFVFKGSVHVSESSGDAVDACTVGQGVCARAGLSAFKVTADFEEAERDFGSVAGLRALKHVQHSLTVADRITALWAERYLPKDEVARKAYLQKIEALRIAASRPSFSKAAWVRPSAAPLQQKENTMIKTSAVALLGAAALMLGGGDATAFSEPAQIHFSPQRNRLWSTLFTNEVPLRWSWPQDASRASLEISGMQGSFVTNFTSATTDCLWKVFDGQTPAREESYHLALTFYNASDVAINGLTSRLALVKGAFGPVPVDPGPSDSQWGKVKENALLPYDADWTAATSGALQSQLVIAKSAGLTQTNLLPDASGYFGWKLVNSPWGYGTFALELSFPGTVTEAWDAALERLPLGTMIMIF